MCNVFLGRCLKTLMEAWTWMASFLLCTAKTAAKYPLTTSSGSWLTSGSESSQLFCYLSGCLITVAQTHFLCIILAYILKGIAWNTTLKKISIQLIPSPNSAL